MSNQTAVKKYFVGGVEIDALTIAQANQLITGHARDKASLPWVVTKPYSEFIDGVKRHPERLRYLNDSDLCLPDGIGLCWAVTYKYGGERTLRRIVTTGARLVLSPRAAYQFLPEKFAGPNAAWPLLEAAAGMDLKVFLIGSPLGTSIEATARFINHRLPKLHIVGTLPGSIQGLTGALLLEQLENGLDITQLAASLNNAKPDLILIGMGFPLQEAVMSRLKSLLNHGVMIGEGGTFDYSSFGGHATRAPQIIQNIGVEWLWRLLSDPKRITRQRAIPRLIWSVYQEGRRKSLPRS
jgi:N-acetylglucosaminyldiphosphoundecaprenol N-acetyl-beta-D-mannosaminyltransferase